MYTNLNLCEEKVLKAFVRGLEDKTFLFLRVMEVSLESSFQPTIQLYLLFPTLVQQVEGDKFVFQVGIL